MSHHFDTKLAKEAPRLNICGLYLFKGAADSTVMVLTTNADAGISSPDTLHPEGLYTVRFDLDGDAHEDVIFKFRFGEPRHNDSEEGTHFQAFQVLRAKDSQIAADAGEVLLEGEIGKARSSADIHASVGIVPELWAADAFAFFTMLNALFEQGRFDRNVFQHKVNLFKNRNAMAIVLEVPNLLIGEGNVHAWGTISLCGHAPEVQVSRWGFPLFTHLFLSNPSKVSLVEEYHAAVPSQDRELFEAAIATFAAELANRAGSTVNPEEHGRQVAERLCPSMLPYELGTEASFNPAVFNGRPLGEDAFDVMLTLAANRPISDGVAPDLSKIREEFPYYGKPYSKLEQAGLSPIQGRIGLQYGSRRA